MYKEAFLDGYMDKISKSRWRQDDALRSFVGDSDTPVSRGAAIGQAKDKLSIVNEARRKIKTKANQTIRQRLEAEFKEMVESLGAGREISEKKYPGLSKYFRKLNWRNLKEDKSLSGRVQNRVIYRGHGHPDTFSPYNIPDAGKSLYTHGTPNKTRAIGYAQNSSFTGNMPRYVSAFKPKNNQVYYRDGGLDIHSSNRLLARMMKRISPSLASSKNIGDVRSVKPGDPMYNSLNWDAYETKITPNHKFIGRRLIKPPLPEGSITSEPQFYKPDPKTNKVLQSFNKTLAPAARTAKSTSKNVGVAARDTFTPWQQLKFLLRNAPDQARVTAQQAKDTGRRAAPYLTSGAASAKAALNSPVVSKLLRTLSQGGRGLPLVAQAIDEGLMASTDPETGKLTTPDIRHRNRHLENTIEKSDQSWRQAQTGLKDSTTHALRSANPATAPRKISAIAKLLTELPGETVSAVRKNIEANRAEEEMQRKQERWEKYGDPERRGEHHPSR